MILQNYLTERLRFRCLTPEDKDLLLEFFSDADATAYLPMSQNIEDYVDSWLARQMRRYDIGNGGLLAVELRETGEMIGQSGLVWQFVDNVPKWEIGYHFLPRFWGMGYATEAAIACRDFCFENEMAETIISLIHPENARSKAVALRNGMTYWKDTVFKNNPTHVFRVRREDWEQNISPVLEKKLAQG